MVDCASARIEHNVKKQSCLTRWSFRISREFVDPDRSSMLRKDRTGECERHNPSIAHREAKSVSRLDLIDHNPGSAFGTCHPRDSEPRDPRDRYSLFILTVVHGIALCFFGCRSVGASVDSGRVVLRRRCRTTNRISTFVIVLLEYRSGHRLARFIRSPTAL